MTNLLKNHKHFKILPELMEELTPEGWDKRVYEEK